MKKILFFAIAVLMLFLTGTVEAANVGDIVNFNVDPDYDATARAQVSATLVRATSGLYFYIEKNWWDTQTTVKQNEILANFDKVSDEFVNNIYPKLTSVYGFEARPGIDGDNKIAVFFESINANLGGYFRSKDEYSKLQDPNSNEKEMLYLPLTKIDSDQLKVFLAHEFVHLIVFNQKEKLQGVAEEIWLSEARSDYASTILGYDDQYVGSNLQRRVQDFLNQPGDALTEWQGTKYDYAVESLFMHYLVDRYGINILTDSLKSKLVGIPSLNEALLKSGAKDDFSQIFTNWTISVIINNCLIDSKYCYTNKNLSNLKINPSLIFLPLVGSSSLTVTNMAKNWAGSWQKIIGGSGDLMLEFSVSAELIFKVPYIIYDKNNNYTVNFLTLDKNGKGQINVKNFGSQYNSLVIIPSLQSKILGFDGKEFSYPYTFTVSITGNNMQQNSDVVQKLLDQIESLKKQIALLQAGGQKPPLCTALNSNLSIGLQGGDVNCLQQFLKMQGSEIYPQGLVTGYFGNLTTSAVIRFQKKFGIMPTGFVGMLTRQKINQLLAL